MATTAKQSSAVNPGSIPLRRSTTDAASTTNIFRLPTYEQVIGNGAALSSRLIKTNTQTVANDVFLPSPQTGSSSTGNTASSLLTNANTIVVSSAASSLLLNQPATDSTNVANHMMLDDNELLRQLEHILSEPGLSLADIDNVFGGCLAVPPASSLPQSLSAVDQKAISVIQSQLMSVETSLSSSSPAAPVSSSLWRNGTLCQLLRGRSPLTSNTLLSELRSQGSSSQSPVLSSATVKSNHIGHSQY